MERRVSRGGFVDEVYPCTLLCCIYEEKLNQQEMKRKLKDEERKSIWCLEEMLFFNLIQPQ